LPSVRGEEREQTYDVRADLPSGNRIHGDHICGGYVRAGERRVRGQWMAVVGMRAGGDDLLMERGEVEVSRMSKRQRHC
jgi:hypothetical protein